MNILIINPMLYTAPLKGAPIKRKLSIEDTMIVNFCKGFLKNGHNVTLIASEEYKPLNDETFGFNIIFLQNSIVGYIPNFPHGFPILKGLRKCLKAHLNEYDFVISSEIFTYHTLIASIVCSRKLVIWQEFGAHHKFMGKIPSLVWHNTVVKLFMKNRAIAVPRSIIAQEFMKRYCNRVSEEIVNNSVDTGLFGFNAQKNDYLIVVSRLIPGKNIRYIVDKFVKYIAKYRSDLKLLIIGDGPERLNLEKHAVELNAENSIIFYGAMSQRELAPMLSGAKGFLCATVDELNMISITEAIVSGTPILTNCVPLQYRFIQQEQLGIAKDNWDEDDINALIVDNELFISNCERMRPTLSNTFLSQTMIDVFKKYKKQQL